MKRSCIIIMSMAVMAIIFCITPASEAYTNLALGGTATQSSTYTGSGGPWGPGNAIDNNSNTISITDPFDGNDWWQVDLKNLYSIRQIIIFNRIGSQHDDINPFSVSIIRNGTAIWTKDIYTTLNDYTWDLITPVVGQIVKVQLTGSDVLGRYLNMREVQVWGDPTPVPIPPTVWLLGSGLIGLYGLRRRFRR